MDIRQATRQQTDTMSWSVLPNRINGRHNRRWPLNTMFILHPDSTKMRKLRTKRESPEGDRCPSPAPSGRRSGDRLIRFRSIRSGAHADRRGAKGCAAGTPPLRQRISAAVSDRDPHRGSPGPEGDEAGRDRSVCRDRETVRRRAATPGPVGPRRPGFFRPPPATPATTATTFASAGFRSGC